MGLLKAIGLQPLFLALLLPKDFLKFPSAPCAVWQRPRIAAQSVCLGGLQGSEYQLLCNGLRHLSFQMLTLLFPRRFCSPLHTCLRFWHLTHPWRDTKPSSDMFSLLSHRHMKKI